jgi:hypothetical protein
MSKLLIQCRTRPLLSRPKPNRYGKCKTELEWIFIHIDPNWQSDSYPRDILPFANILESTSRRLTSEKYVITGFSQILKKPKSQERSFSAYLDVGRLFTLCNIPSGGRRQLERTWKGSTGIPPFRQVHLLFQRKEKKRKGFTSRRCHLKQRDANGANENIERWMDNMQQLIAEHTLRGDDGHVREL